MFGGLMLLLLGFALILWVFGGFNTLLDTAKSARQGA